MIYPGEKYHISRGPQGFLIYETMTGRFQLITRPDSKALVKELNEVANTEDWGSYTWKMDELCRKWLAGVLQ